jgi:hypothetical protein
MRLIWHVFKKDTRRLWWEIAVTLGLLAWLAHLDRWRADYTPGSMEGWLNVLLPFAWSYLIALAVLEDPLVGDRQFWIAVPCRWYSLLAAKALFVAAFIHVPYLLAGAAILLARGFPPFLYLPQLFSKQLVLLVALTLPAAAVAAIVKNIMQVMLLAILVAAGVVAVNGGMGYLPWMPDDPLQRILALAALASGSVAIALLQYARRRTMVSRAVAVAAALVAALVYGWLPREASAAVRCALSPARSPISIRLSPGPEAPPEIVRAYARWRDAVTIAIPVDLSGASANAPAWFGQLALEIEGRRGDRYEMSWPTTARPKTLLQAWLHPYDDHAWQVLRMDRSTYDRLQKDRVKLKGKVVAHFFRRAAATLMPFAARRTVPGVGTCSSLIASGWGPSKELIRVDCESPAQIPEPTLVRLIDPNTRREWAGSLGDSVTPMPYPRLTWLSPINRRSTFFHLTTEDVSAHEGSRWLVPEEVVARAELEITPQLTIGCRLVNYEFSGVLLSRFQVAPAPPPANAEPSRRK